MKLKTVPITLAIFVYTMTSTVVVADLLSQQNGSVHKLALTERNGVQNYNNYHRKAQVKAALRLSDAASSHEKNELATDRLRLNIDSYKVRGYHTAHLSWQGANTSSVVIYRDGQMIVVTDNDGDFIDDLNSRSRGVVYSYQICELGTNDCSNSVLSAF